MVKEKIGRTCQHKNRRQECVNKTLVVQEVNPVVDESNLSIFKNFFIAKET